MSKADFKKVIKKLANDDTFIQQVNDTPDAALAGFNLTPDEVTLVKACAKGMS
jgi:hypothetical protein